MKNRLLSVTLFVVCILLLSTMPVLAQTELDATYTSDDETFEISYPSSWTVDDDDPAFIVLAGIEGGEPFAMTVFSTETISLFAVGTDSAMEVAEIVAEAVDFVQDDIQEFPIPGRDATISSVSLDGQDGVAFVMEMDNGDYGMVIVLADVDVMTDNIDFVVDVVSSYNTPGGSSSTGNTKGSSDSKGSSSEGMPEELSDYDGDWEDAVEELEDLGVIDSGGGLVFEEDSAFFTGQGYFFTALGRRSPHTDIVMAGEIEFTSGSSDFEHCSLLARLVDPGRGNNVETYLQVGIDNEGALFYVDTEGSDDTFIVDGVSLGLDLDDPQHILFILLDEKITIYLNGVLVIDEAEVNDARAGTYGIALSGQDRGSRCDGSNIWVYQVQNIEEGVCEISSTGTVNKRSGPGTSFDRDGTLNAGTTLEAVGYSVASDGFLWWELEDGSWVREDIVNAAGDCNNVPES